MEVVRRGGKVGVERNGLWREVAEAAGLEYKSDADVESLLALASTIRGTAAPTWEEKATISKKELSNSGNSSVILPTTAISATAAPVAAAPLAAPTSTPAPIAEQNGTATEQLAAGAATIDGLANKAGAGASTAVPPAAATTVTAAAAVEPAADSGSAVKPAAGKAPSKGKGKEKAAASKPTEVEEAAAPTANGKEKKRKKRNSKAVEEVADQQNVYTVEKIVGKRKRRGKIEYQIKWEGYPESANTWEKEEDVFCAELIAVFEAELQEKAQKRKRKAIEVKTEEDASATTPQPQPSTETQPTQATQTPAQTQPGASTEAESALQLDVMDVTRETEDSLDEKPSKKARKSPTTELKQNKEGEATTVPSSDLESDVKVGFDFGDEIENILGIQRTKDGHLCAYVTWLGKDDCSYVPTQLIALKAPQKLIAFYESHITFEGTVSSKASSS